MVDSNDWTTVSPQELEAVGGGEVLVGEFVEQGHDLVSQVHIGLGGLFLGVAEVLREGLSLDFVYPVNVEPDGAAGDEDQGLLFEDLLESEFIGDVLVVFLLLGLLLEELSLVFFLFLEEPAVFKVDLGAGLILVDFVLVVFPFEVDDELRGLRLHIIV